MTVGINLEIKTQKKIQNVLLLMTFVLHISKVNSIQEQLSDINKNKGWLIKNLRLFMETLTKNPLKQCSICHIICCGCRNGSHVWF